MTGQVNAVGEGEKCAGDVCAGSGQRRQRERSGQRRGVLTASSAGVGGLARCAVSAGAWGDATHLGRDRGFGWGVRVRSPASGLPEAPWVQSECLG